MRSPTPVPRSRLLSLALLACAAPAVAQTAAVTGRVLDERGAPFPYATVQVEGTLAGAVSEEDGRFAFDVDPIGEAWLVASMVGYEPSRVRVDLVGGDTVAADLVLYETILSLGNLEVSASAYTTAEGTNPTLSALDVVMTPGASADVFRAVQTFAGVTQANEGAGLFVRGGDEAETLTILDLAPLRYPYKYESPTTVVSGTIPPFLLKGTSFSAGGFSARYGNALSAVLDMRTRDRPETRSYYLNAGLGAVSAGVDLPIAGDRLGVRLSGNRSLSGLMFRINGESADFEQVPTSLDGNVSVSYVYAPGAVVKAFTYAATDELGVRTTSPSFSGVFQGEQTNRLHTVYWTDVLGPWKTEASASYTRRTARQRFGALDLRPEDASYALRVDAERTWARGVEWAVGAEVQRIGQSITGTIPTSNVLGPEGPSVVLDESLATTLVGTYLEGTARPLRRLAVRAGLRVDAHTLSGTSVVDPRVAARYALADGLDLRAAWGIYHQYATPETYSTGGTLDLAPQRAQHFILGLEHQRELLHVRAEGYWKPYGDLVLEDADGGGLERRRGPGSGDRPVREVWGVPPDAGPRPRLIQLPPGRPRPVPGRRRRGRARPRPGAVRRLPQPDGRREGADRGGLERRGHRPLRDRPALHAGGRGRRGRGRVPAHRGARRVGPTPLVLAGGRPDHLLPSVRSEQRRVLCLRRQPV